jgi:3-hydroxyacyl-CoA dehydrogenase / enoyl-CoA hydratase / 3-hydroxybutyryl-CoA epimerase
MSGAFQLEVGAEGLASLTFDLPEKKANIFSRPVLAELEALIAELRGRGDVAVLVLRSGKEDIFVAGADVDGIERVTDAAEAEAGSRLGHRLFSAWEALPFPTVAAIRGTCLGGGTELALASTWIAASDRPDLRIGLPEVRLGILPGWGGCTRLPRRVGLLAALDMILASRNVSGSRAVRLGLADVLLPDAGFDGRARDWALSRVGKRRRSRGAGGLKGLLLEGNPLGRRFVLGQARAKTLAQTKGRYPAPLRAIEVVGVGLDRGRAAGFDAEARAVGELAVSPVAKNLIHVFRLVEESKRDDGPAPAEVRRPAVLGAGVMGGGIAQLIADKAGLAVRIKGIRPEALGTALRHAAGLFSKQVARRRLEPAEMKRRMNLLQPTLEDSGLAACDFVVEAVVENLAVKQKVFADLDRRLQPTAILASNTSSLSIDAIGQNAAHRGRVVGMHFFNPVDKMPLVEVVVGRNTSPEAARGVAAFARRLGKTPVLVRECPGFLVNRLLMFYSAEALWLLDEGHRIEDIDRAMLRWGMPMGPMRLADEVGLDVAAKVGHILTDAFGERLPFPAWLDRLPESGRLGLKNGHGIYRYEGRKEKAVDATVYGEIGITPTRRDPDLDALAERMILPMVNEAARCLEEGVVDGPGPLDLALIFGTGFPPWRGGLCRWADEQGLPRLIEKLERLARDVGPRHEPSDALRRLAAAGGFYAAATD